MYKKIWIFISFCFVFYPQIIFAEEFVRPSEYWDLFFEVRDTIENQYVEKGLNEKILIYGAIRGYLDALGDEYTRFLTPERFSEMKLRLRGEFFGIGVHIGIRNSMLTIISTIPGSPAYKAGLKNMDKIVAIDGIDALNLSLKEAIGMIRGPRGSTVDMKIRRKGLNSDLELEIVRDLVRLNAVSCAQILEDNIGYIKLATFENQDAVKEIENKLAELSTQDVRALILDLRNNGGGLFQNAILIADMFLDNAVVVKTIDRDMHEKIARAGPLTLFDGPLVVLVNHGSASASEILAGAIKDNKRGILVGERSFGKASVQSALELSDGSAILYTVAKYLTPLGTDITKKGVTVNVVVGEKEFQSLKESNPSLNITLDDIQLQEAVHQARMMILQ